jgi:hypothetical protein
MSERYTDIVRELVCELTDEQLRGKIYAECVRRCRLAARALDSGWRGPNHAGLAAAWNAELERVSYWEPREV